MKFIILAGGSGTRLFPLSRKNSPKQFLNLTSKKSLLQETILRLKSDNFMVVSANNSYYTLKSQLEDIKKFAKDRILLEPYPRNTAPAIIYALSKTNEELIAVLPSDHYIKDEKEFLNVVAKAEKFASLGYLVTIGIKPSYAHTGYGYIELKEEFEKNVFRVEKFVEKPNLEKAKSYLQSGNFLWNAGMFVFKKSVFLKELKSASPDLYNFYQSLISSSEDELKELYKKVEKISVDYAVMEKSKNIVSIMGNFGWNDIGGFKSLKNVLQENSNKNVGKYKNLISIDSNNNIIFSSKDIVSLIGIKNKAIIDTKDVLLVSDLDKSQDIKKVYEKVNELNPQTIVNHPDEERPWGKFESIFNGDKFKVKWIKVKKGERLSLQYHNKREEHWVIVKGEAIMTLGERKFKVKRGDYVNIPVRELHTIEGITDVEFIEVQMGEYLGEDDIVRIEDKYHRNNQSL